MVYLYRELGKYLEAAMLLDEYISKNISFLSPSLHSQLEWAVKYLQKTDELLIEAGQPGLPFSKVPQLIKLEAEQALKK